MKITTPVQALAPQHYITQWESAVVMEHSQTRSLFMFVRWKRRKLVSTSDYSLDATLVSSERNGSKIRQRFIKHLGSISEKHKRKLESRIAFWARADRSLDSLALNQVLREFLESQLSAKIPRPEEQEKTLFEEKLKSEFADCMAKLDKKIVERESKSSAATRHAN
jgi:hypothetical protein